MLLSILFFALNTLAIRGIALHFPACDGWQVTLFRGLAGTLIAFALYGGNRGMRFASIFDRPLVFIRGLIGAIGVVCFYITVINLGPARAVVLNLTYPIFAAILAAIFLKESLSTFRIIWIVIGFLGLLIFLSPKTELNGFSFYDAIALLGALLSAIVILLVRVLHRTEHGSTIFVSQAFYAFLITLPFAHGKTSEIPALGITAIIVAGIVVAFGQLTMTFAYRHLEVSKGASMQMILPILTAAGAWALFGETLGPIEICGAVLTLGATWMINRKASNKLPIMPTIQPKNS